MRQAVIHIPLVEEGVFRLGRIRVLLQPGLPELVLLGFRAGHGRALRSKLRAAFSAAALDYPRSRVLVELIGAPLEPVADCELAIALAILMAEKGKGVSCLASGSLEADGTVGAPRYSLGLTFLGKSHDLPWLALSGVGKGGCCATLAESWVTVTQGLWREHSTPAPVRKPLAGYAIIDALRGTSSGKRALLIALAGDHHLLLSGPPGSGKSLLAEAAAELLDDLTEEEALRREATGAPVARSALIAPAQKLRDMETAFREQAGGVLVLDELHLLPGLFRNRLLKLLESPGPRLCIGTLNRCRCGRTGVPGARCLCTGYQQAQFQALLSEALLDRVPLHAQCEYVHDRAPASSVGAIFAETILRVRRAPRGLVWDAAALSLFERAINQFGLSFRAEEHARRVCETIALVENKQVIGADQVHEAL